MNTNAGGSGAQFTAGPWQWEVTPGGEVRLSTPDRGKLYVMGFARQGMRGAQPRFSLWGEGERGRRGGIMHDFVAAGGPDHPDARLIAAAPDLYALAQQYASECAECSGTGRVERHLDTGGYGSDVEGDCPDCADIRAVIAKAVGHV